MPRSTRRLGRPVRTAAAVALTTALAVLAGSPAGGTGSAGTEAAPLLPSPAATAPLYEFVAAPDFLNQDVGDLRGLRSWHRGLPNSWTPRLQRSIDGFLDEITGRHPDSVLVPGDLVEGHWGRDDMRTAVFGPTRTEAQKVRALRRAADFYYRTYRSRFTTRGLTLHAALGDHDIGDNPWDDRNAYNRFKRRHIDDFRRQFAQHFTRSHGRPRYADRPVGTPWADTAYAVGLAPEVLLVTLDEFHTVAHDVRFEVVDGQLAWLRRTLRDARRDGVQWIVVQGHNPVLWPVRSRSSSNGHVAGGKSSLLWRTLARFDVDLYLSGEVHDTTVRRALGVTQVSTGGLLYSGHATYLAATVYADRIELDVRELAGRNRGPLLWQTSGWRTRSTTTYPAPSTSAGSMTLLADGAAVGQRGKLAPYLR